MIIKFHSVPKVKPDVDLIFFNKLKKELIKKYNKKLGYVLRGLKSKHTKLSKKILKLDSEITSLKAEVKEKQAVVVELLNALQQDLDRYVQENFSDEVESNA